MKQIAFVFAVVFFTTTKPFAQSNECDCLDNLNVLVAKTEENYAGFPTKVNELTRSNYEKLVAELQEKALKETNPKKCFYVLEGYVRFFYDKHFRLSYHNGDDHDHEIVDYSPHYIQRRLAAKNLSDIEGIWTNPDSSLQLAILKFPDDVFKGIVTQSKDPNIPIGLVYLTLTPSGNRFIAKEYDSFISVDVPAKQSGNLLQIWNFNMYGKIYPTNLTDSEKMELDTWKDNNNGLFFKQLSDQTAYLKIPTFLNNDEKIQQLVFDNDSIIRTCENLIVDLTGNGGGNTGWVPILPYLQTNAVVQFDSYLRVTPENTKMKLADLEPFVLYPIPDEYKKYFPDEVLTAYQKAYQELPTTEEPFYPIPGVTFPLDSILAKPSKIALMVDDFCGSSTEYFFFLSKQSKKTRTYGINTIGMMDYEGMSIPTPMPYANFSLVIPIAKMSWTDEHPIDQTGFRPDVILDDTAQSNWIEQVRQDLEQR